MYEHACFRFLIHLFLVLFVLMGVWKNWFTGRIASPHSYSSSSFPLSLFLLFRVGLRNASRKNNNDSYFMLFLPPAAVSTRYSRSNRKQLEGLRGGRIYGRRPLRGDFEDSSMWRPTRFPEARRRQGLSGMFKSSVCTYSSTDNHHRPLSTSHLFVILFYLPERA